MQGKTQLDSDHAVAGIICARVERFDDDIPRVRDVDLGEWLELERPRDIRQTIERNHAELEHHGGLRFETANLGPEGGRPTSEYWLNEAQALTLCALSRTPRASEVRVALVQAFIMLRRGNVAPLDLPSTHLMVAIQELGDKILQATTNICTDIGAVQGDVARLYQRVERVEDRLETIHQTRRKDPRERDVQAMVLLVAAKYAGLCVCCEDVEIVHDGARTEQFSVDHWHGRNDARPQHLWPVCRRCNDRLHLDPAYKRESYEAFAVYQKRRMRLQPQQMLLM